MFLIINADYYGISKSVQDEEPSVHRPKYPM